MPLLDTMWLYIAVISSFLFLFSKMKTRSRQSSRTLDRRIPGPRQYPFIGNLSLFMNPKFALLTQDMVQKYGPIFKLRNMRKKFVVVGNETLIKEVLTQQVFNGTPDGPFYRLNSYFNKEDSTEGMRVVHRMIVRKLAPFSSTFLTDTSFSESATSNLIQKMRDSNGAAYSPYNDIDRFTISVMANLLAGKYGHCLTDRMYDCLSLMRPGIRINTQLLVDMLPWLKNLGFRSSRFDKINDYLDKIYNICETKLSDLNEEDTSSMMQVVFQEHRSSEDKWISHPKLPKLLMTIVLFGGTGTITKFLNVAFAVLAHYPNIQSRMRNELDSVEEGHLPDVDSCPYTRATILEIMRNTGLTVTIAPHMALEDTTIAGYTIPEGTGVLIHAWNLHHDAKLWEDPYVYKPERLLDNEGRFLSVDHPVRRQIIPFHAGPRACPGQAFARACQFRTICATLKRFIIKPEHHVDPSVVDPRALLFNRKINLRFHERRAV